MEAVKFIRTLQKLCEGRGCDDCPLHDKDRCDVRYVEDPEETVRIVEEWEKEHLEIPDKERQKQEKDDVEGAIYREIVSNKTRIENLEYDVAVIRHNLAELHDKAYALIENVDHTPATELSQTPEQKRTNKDVLLKVFPNARMNNNGIPNVCPLTLDKHYDCDKFTDCEDCRCVYWNTEVEE